MIFEDVFNSANSSDENELCELSLSEISSELDLDQVMSFSPISDEDEETRLDFLEGWLNSTSRMQYNGMAEFFLGGVPAIKNFGNSPLEKIDGREKSFEGNWSPSMLLSAHQLAYNGFFFANFPDEVTCYFCGLTMRSLNPSLVNQLEDFHFHNSMALNFEVPCEHANERLKEKQTQEASAQQLFSNSWLPTLNSVKPEVLQAELTSVPGEEKLTSANVSGGDGHAHLLPSTCPVSSIPGVVEWGSGTSGDGGVGISGGGGGGGSSGGWEPWNPWGPWGQGTGGDMFTFGGQSEQCATPGGTLFGSGNEFLPLTVNASAGPPPAVSSTDLILISPTAPDNGIHP